MHVEHKMIGSTLYIGLGGELDESCATYVRDAVDAILERYRMQRVVINLEQLSFMDSTGIGVLIGRYRKLKSRSIPMWIQSPQSSVDRVLRLTGIYEIMPKIAE